MKTLKTSLIVSILLCIISLPQTTLFAEPEASPKSKVNLGSFATEILKVNIEGALTEFAMWFPYEFFVEASLAEGGTPRTIVEQNMEFLKPYITIVAQANVAQSDGISLYSTEEEIRGRAALIAPDGTEIPPLDDVPPMVGATVVAMKALLASEGDPSGQSTYILVFPNKDKEGRPIIDINKKDKLSLLLKPDGPFQKTVFTWRTPFNALADVPPCPECGEKVLASWSYCAWCGNDLAK